mgnify:CR=1 FL=1
MRAGTSTEFNPIFPMSNQPAQTEQKLTSIIGQSYSGSVTTKIDLLLGALASRTIPEQLMLLENAFLGNNAVHELATEAQANRAEITALRAENDSLKQKFADANARADNAVSSAKAAMRAEVEMLADARAKEMLLSVGQPIPTRVRPNSGSDADKPRMVGVEAAAAYYREKHNIN